MHVIPSRDAVMIETENVYMFTLDRNRFDTRLCVDGTFINIGSSVQDDIWIRRRNDTWMVFNTESFVFCGFTVIRCQIHLLAVLALWALSRTFFRQLRR